VIENILNRLGYQTDYAADGIDALANCRRTPTTSSSWTGNSRPEWCRGHPSFSPMGGARASHAGHRHHRLLHPGKAQRMPRFRDGRVRCQAAQPREDQGHDPKLERAARRRSRLQTRAAEGPPRRALDLSIFRYLSDQNPAKRRQLVEQFISTLDKDVAVLAGAVGAGDLATTRRQAHLLLSQTALVAATPVATVAATIQEAARKGDIETPRSVLGSFEASVAGLKQSLLSALEKS